MLLTPLQESLRLLLLLLLKLLHGLRHAHLQRIAVAATSVSTNPFTILSGRIARPLLLTFLRVGYLEDRASRGLICQLLGRLSVQVVVTIG